MNVHFRIIDRVKMSRGVPLGRRSRRVVRNAG
jgi:hypothetical protein